MSPHEAFRELIATPQLPALGPQRPPGTMPIDPLNRALDELFARQKISSHALPALRSAALLWHDHLDASHTISQGIETREGSWLHGIMHRREPDYGNAKYWFRRLGRHEAFPQLAQRVSALLDRHGGRTGALVENGEWMPFAFVDECERAEQGSDPALTAVLQQIQAAEFDVLVEHLFAQSP